MKLEGTHVMVDLETLGTSPGSVIIAIGAARFNAHGVLDTFYRRISAEDCVRCGLTMDTSTIEWWMQQSDEARAVFKQPGLPLQDALIHFNTWYPTDAPLWGNGAAFDNALLDAAYRVTSVKKPWPYWGDMCYRTIKAQNKHIKAEPFAGVKHNALDDAVHQANHLIKIMGEA